VARTKRGILVTVKSHAATEEGDKLCFDPATSLLTRSGWKPVAAISADDEIATLNAADELEYQRPTSVHHYRHDGLMYFLNTKHVNMLVTPNHRLWVARPGEPYRGVPAEEFYRSRGEWQFKKDCQWIGMERTWFASDPYVARTSRDQYLDRIPMDDWLEFLGFYLAEGQTHYNPANGSWQVRISQFPDSDAWQDIHDNLTRIGLRFSYNTRDKRFEITSKWLYGILDPLGDSYTKYVPAYVQELCPRQLQVFLAAYLKGDGHTGACWEYGSSSAQLAVDIQVICLKLGWAVSIKKIERTDNWQKHPHWRGRINRKHLRPWWKKGRAARYESIKEEMVAYSGDVYCVTVPNHVVYCKREDKTYWSHNSGRYG
jgi:hypothetical protein